MLRNLVFAWSHVPLLGVRSPWLDRIAPRRHHRGSTRFWSEHCHSSLWTLSNDERQCFGNLEWFQLWALADASTCCSRTRSHHEMQKHQQHCNWKKSMGIENWFGKTRSQLTYLGIVFCSGDGWVTSAPITITFPGDWDNIGDDFSL